ncbi:MAG: VPLPA-CTERM sorting domain-containing protein [Pseudomonadota bacterium]
MCVSSAAFAAIVTFTDRVAFTDATEPLLSEDFEGFDQDTGFASIAPEITDFSLSVTKNSPDLVGSGFNKIETQPYPFSSTSPANQNTIDGSSYAVVGLEDDGSNLGDVFSVLFDYDVFAFGADFAKLNDNDITRSRFDFLDADGNNVGGFVPDTQVNGSVRFFGFLSDQAFRTITVTAISGTTDGEGFGMDNLLYSAEPSEIPLPASLPLLAAGIAAFGFLRRSKAPRA